MQMVNLLRATLFLFLTIVSSPSDAQDTPSISTIPSPPLANQPFTISASFLGGTPSNAFTFAGSFVGDQGGGTLQFTGTPDFPYQFGTVLVSVPAQPAGAYTLLFTNIALDPRPGYASFAINIAPAPSQLPTLSPTGCAILITLLIAFGVVRRRRT